VVSKLLGVIADWVLAADGKFPSSFLRYFVMHSMVYAVALVVLGPLLLIPVVLWDFSPLAILGGYAAIWLPMSTVYSIIGYRQGVEGAKRMAEIDRKYSRGVGGE
jgi:hypothetical protein